MFKYLLIALPILMAITIHEYAHGYVAYLLGDPTARNSGRLSLNPLKHLDPLGTLMLFIVHFGWARPVPVDPSYFKNPRKGMLWVGLAGPGANILAAFVLGTIFRLFVIL
ncbi:site-2 protease family protein, partial [bacterium]|nr:site-2 protease family protein [bacterium]